MCANRWLVNDDADCSKAALLPNTDWSYDGDLKLLRQDFRNITDPQRDREVKRVIKMVAVSIYC